MHSTPGTSTRSWPRTTSTIRGCVRWSRRSRETPDGGLLLPSAQFTYWYVVPPPGPIPRAAAGHTVFFLNLGMTSMNVGLDVRVIDQMGLAYPLAAHTERLEDGRIGHDKNLYPDWVVADTGMVDVRPWLPCFLDEDWVADAKLAHHVPGNAGVAHVVPLRADLGQIQTELPAGFRLREVPIRPGSGLRIGTLRARSAGATQVM